MKEVSRAIITNENGAVLLGKRSRGIGAGLFSLIGGKPDTGESAEQAVIREVREEIGLNFIPFFYLEEVDISSNPTDPWKVTYFTGQATGELILAPGEVEEVVYVTLDDLEKLPIAFNQKERLIDYFQSQK